MTAESKWVIGAVAFSICFFIGWMFPLLWLLAIIGAIVLVATPTKPKPGYVVSQTQDALQPSYQYQNCDNYNPSALEQEIQAKANAEPNENVRMGLLQALEIVRKNSYPASVGMFNDTEAYEPMMPVSEQTEEEKRLAKQKQELKNINTILYTASSLLVGAAVALIAVTDGVADIVKFVGLLLVAAAFYGSGMVLHASSERLRPAATAFVGTGLALVPFVGLAMYWYVLPNTSIVWWLTSLVGLLGFFGAIIRIRTNVMAYLTLAFVFSFSVSSVAVLQAPLVWYFISVIAVGSLLTFAYYKKPGWVPQNMLQPLEQNAQLAAPVALIGYLFAINTFGPWDYVLISGVASLHYLVNALGFATDKTRLPYWNAARALLLVFVASFTYAVTSDWKLTFASLNAAAALNHFYSIRKHPSSVYETIWLWLSQSIMIVLLAAWYDDKVLFSIQLAVIILTSLHQLLVVRRVEYGLSGIIAGLILPIIVGRQVVDPAIGYEMIATAVLILGAASLVIRALLHGRTPAFKYIATISYCVLFSEAILLSVASLDSSWMAAIMMLTGVGLFLASYIERQPLTLIASNIVCIIGVLLMYGQIFDDFTWAPLVTGLTLSGIWYALRWYFVSNDMRNEQNTVRADILMIFVISLLGLMSLISMFASDDTIVAAALIGCLTAGVLVFESYVRKQRYLSEVALYIATFCLQRLVGYVYPDASLLLYTHWWALTAGLSIILYYQRTKDWATVLVRAVVALTILSVPTGLYALVQPDTYQWLFLIEHVVLAVAGLLTNKKLLVLWGSIGIGLGVLYFLKNYTYALLALIAIGLIGLAVWRLIKSSNK